MLSPIEALLLGILQGVTEFLPVSSSGHLVVVQHLFGTTEPILLFDILVHVATLIAVVGFYRKDLRRLAADGFGAVRALSGGTSPRAVVAEFPGCREILLLALASIPTALIGLGLKPYVGQLFHSLREVGTMLVLTGLVLVSTRSKLDRPNTSSFEWSLGAALLIGTAQGIAVIPGISRAGMTIAVALWLGASPRHAARFSFLLSIPAILGALILGSGELELGVSTLAMVSGFLAAMVAGYASLTLLVQLVEKQKFAWFAPYCLLLGTLLFVSAS